MDPIHDVNLLELVLFYAIPRQDTNPIAHRLLDTFGSLAAVFDATPEELMDTLNDLVTEEYRSRVPLKPGADRLLARLADSGISCCIATASEAFQARSAMERLGLWPHFRFAVSCVQYGGKTRPDIYLEAARRLGTAPAETVVFEDALHAARTAHEAGFRVCGVWDASAEEDQAALKALADWYVRDLGDWVP